MSQKIEYTVALAWDGSPAGTANVREYTRDHIVSADGKVPIQGSADAIFRGDKGRWNPEEMLVASMAQCHMLWYLNLAARAGITVLTYHDNPTGTLIMDADGSGRFSEMTLHPMVIVADIEDIGRAAELHDKAHKFCFVANSVNFQVHIEPSAHADPAPVG